MRDVRYEVLEDKLRQLDTLFSDEIARLRASLERIHEDLLDKLVYVAAVAIFGLAFSIGAIAVMLSQ